MHARAHAVSSVCAWFELRKMSIYVFILPARVCFSKASRRSERPLPSTMRLKRRKDPPRAKEEEEEEDEGAEAPWRRHRLEGFFR